MYYQRELETDGVCRGIVSHGGPGPNDALGKPLLLEENERMCLNRTSLQQGAPLPTRRSHSSQHLEHIFSFTAGGQNLFL